ncbi:MAG: hypothetical protein COT85_04580 [Chlamydiae bacterium CG10_big_fil_rev_8_21_14_0_10_42_34]|nr:MAG: hypothetical protein COT85_04580 [Chlamydiae bacterium CG10_big_fil_rev_8_21_14_0_10_42_34]
MRAIGTFPNENHARRFAQYLTHVGIGNNCEGSFAAGTGHMSYQIWIHEEDKLETATNLLNEFLKNPMDSKFDAPIPEPEPVPTDPNEELAEELPPRHFKNFVTNFLIALCCMVYFLNTLQEIPLSKQGFPEQAFLMTPMQAQFMFDLPPAFAQLEESLEKFGAQNPQSNQPPAGLLQEIESANQSSYWKGAYEWVVNKIDGTDTSLGEGPLFSSIRQGEIWRLFTPVILHRDLLHILFNMLWLWYLGRPIEQRIGPFRMLLFTLIAAIGTNTLQYLMSGPFFIGYSGIVTALAGFIWMREKIAPWEGYPLNKSTVLFLLFFIAAIFALQLVAFFIQVFTTHNFTPNIANTAHIAGVFIGVFLARFKYFAQRVCK